MPKRPADEFNPVQAFVDHLGRQWFDERKRRQLTLGQLIELLERVDPDRMITGFGVPESYRGYYEDLAFAPHEEPYLVRALLETCRNDCMGRKFQGYKGGYYVMAEDTPLWIARWGDASGQMLMGLDLDADPIRPVTAKEDDHG